MLLFQSGSVSVISAPSWASAGVFWLRHLASGLRALWRACKPITCSEPTIADQ